MADKDSSQSDEGIPLDCISADLLPSQSPAPPKPLLAATASANRVAPQTFHRFPELPAELRIAIWELCLPQRIFTLPLRSTKFDFLNKRWTREQAYGAKDEQPPAIAHVCFEARALVMASGSLRNIFLFRIRSHGTKTSYKWSRAWIDSKRDTAVINIMQSLHPGFNNDHINSLFRNRDMHVAIDSSWGLSSLGLDELYARVIRTPVIRDVYHKFVRGHKKCDFVVLDLQLDITKEEAASTGLFGNSGASDGVLIPIEDTQQMSRLFDAQAKFSTVDWLDKWKNFTQFRGRTNLVEFMQRWKKLAAREMRKVQRTLDFLMGVEVGRQGKDVGELRKQAARAAEIRAEHPKIRPVIMVSQGVGSRR